MLNDDLRKSNYSIKDSIYVKVFILVGAKNSKISTENDKIAAKTSVQRSWSNSWTILTFLLGMVIWYLRYSVISSDGDSRSVRFVY